LLGTAALEVRAGADSEVRVELDEITGAIVESSIDIHRRLGPGVFESVYETVLAVTLERRGLRVGRQVPIGFSFDGIALENGFRLDLLVEDRVIVELKSIERFAPVHRKQLLTYLRLTELRVGLLLNFGADTMKEGLRRVVNDLAPSHASLIWINRGAALGDVRADGEDAGD
jgi:GxxExxY protein